MKPHLLLDSQHLSCCSGTNEKSAKDSDPAGRAKQGADGGGHFAAIEGTKWASLQLAPVIPGDLGRQHSDDYDNATTFG